MLERGGAQREEEPPAVSFFLIRFTVCLVLFLGFCMLDYTRASVYHLDSREILAKIQENTLGELTFHDLDFKAATADLWKSVRITEGE